MGEAAGCERFDSFPLKALAACMTRLVSPSNGDTVSTALVSDINQSADRAVIQITKSHFSFSPASSADRADLCR